MTLARSVTLVGKSAKDRSDQELRAITLGVHEGRIITNAQAREHRWRLYATQRPLTIEFVNLTRADMAKLKKFSEEVAAWERGARMVLHAVGR